MPDPDLLAELDAMNCRCSRDPDECAEAGGCRWTRALADRERQVRQKVAEDIRTIWPDTLGMWDVNQAMAARATKNQILKRVTGETPLCSGDTARDAAPGIAELRDQMAKTIGSTMILRTSPTEIADAVLARDVQPVIDRWERYANNATAETEELRRGEADDPGEPGTWPTPAQWIRRWNDTTPERRLELAAGIVDAFQQASRCRYTEDHRGRLLDLLRRAESAEAERDALKTGITAAVQQIRAWMDPDDPGPLFAPGHAAEVDRTLKKYIGEHTIAALGQPTTPATSGRDPAEPQDNAAPTTRQTQP
jgi:hypothetical protein